MRSGAVEAGLSKQCKCRACGQEFTQSPNDWPRNPKTNEAVKSCFYGGYTCDNRCEAIAVARMERSIDEHHDPSGWYRAKAKAADVFD